MGFFYWREWDCVRILVREMMEQLAWREDCDLRQDKDSMYILDQWKGFSYFLPLLPPRTRTHKMPIQRPLFPFPLPSSRRAITTSVLPTLMLRLRLIFINTHIHLVRIHFLRIAIRLPFYRRPFRPLRRSLRFIIE